LRHLRQAEILEFQLRFERLDLRLERHGIDTKQDVTGLQRGIALDRNVDHLPGNARNDRDRIPHDQGRPLWGAPHPIGINSPKLKSNRTMNGDAFQNKLKATMPSRTIANSRTR
jgi:hypothetical protein